MAKNYVVTVGRQFGSMGRPIAKRTAELLGIEYYDRDIVEEVAKRMDMPLKLISREEEEANHKFGTYGKTLFPLSRGTTELQHFDMTPLQARKMCADVDKARRAYHLRYAGYEPMDTEHMDLLLSSTALGIEGIAQALAALIRRRFDEPAS